MIESDYVRKLRQKGEYGAADYIERLECLNAKMQTALQGDCTVCANSDKCIIYPCFCINGRAWKLKELV